MRLGRLRKNLPEQDPAYLQVHKFLSLAAGLRQGAGRSGEPESLRVKFVKSDREPELHEVGLGLLYQTGLMGPASPVYTPAGPTGAGSVVPDTPGPQGGPCQWAPAPWSVPGFSQPSTLPFAIMIPGRRPARLARELPAFPINP